MVRPAIFIVMRIAFFALRIVLVKNGISEGVLSESYNSRRSFSAGGQTYARILLMMTGVVWVL